ncbi:DJ-1/PfpI family protein [Mycoplasmopsis gallopavonis]|uniref:Monophosphate biosynthesis n=1 Tax=Mycoplasmopsis gallopavonis TaxID=76629 RepID=A0A449AZQ7_9BACT|nr:DJ-1/PfpI family protein [Mycoplasmopsis gallopavonis]RIV16729.1 DJ-1 family protein [Mycoplasmopsis gallopavonis]VEU72965.1 monophosphate biosynthesis [Mycoplasmopsis gallopavonis]
MNLLVIAQNYFNDIEMTTVLSCLKRSGKLEKLDYYNPSLQNVEGQYGITKLDNILNEVNIDEYDGLYVPGGKGAQTLRTDLISLNLISEFLKKDKYLFAICDAPNVLVESKIIDQTKPYSAFPSEWAKETRTEFYSNDYVTQTGAKILTGRSADASMELGLAILNLVYGKDIANFVYQGMTGRSDKKF